MEQVRGGWGAKLLGRLIIITMLSLSGALANGVQPGPLSRDVRECRKEAAERFIEGFFQAGPPHERVEGSGIIVTVFRNDNPRGIDEYASDCLKRRSLLKTR